MPIELSSIINYQLSIQSYFVRPVSYPYDVDAGLQAVVLLQAYLFFVLHDCTAHADDDDLLTLRGLNIEASILCIDLHALDRFDTRRIFFFFRAFGFDVDVGPDVFNRVFAGLRAFLQFIPRIIIAFLVINMEVVEGVIRCVFLYNVVVADGIGRSGLADAYLEVHRTPIRAIIVCGGDGGRAGAIDREGFTAGRNRPTS